ncbi:MAG: ArdC-like ssDNA-binding domain-containing protein [Planctomycetota bacterium]
MALDIYQHVTDRVIQALEHGTVPWRSPVRTRGGRWPHNIVTNREYRGINTFLLALTAMAEGYRSGGWLTFRQAQARGAHVKKGEKSTLVIFWKPHQTNDKESGEDITVPVLRHYRVFNAEQCDRLAVEDGETGEEIAPFQRIKEAESICEGFVEGPEVVHGGVIPRYEARHDRVELPDPEAFVSAEEYYATRFHELGHATGHSTRLDRGVDTQPRAFGSAEYAKEELIAEMTAAMLCGVAGIDAATIDNAAAYVQSWLQRLRDDKQLVVTAAGKAQKAADYVLGRER